MAWPSVSARTKTWGTEILTASDLDGQYDIIHTYLNDMLNGTSGHGHTGSTNDGKKLDLTTAMSGILPIANGGTNLSSAGSTANRVVVTINGTTFVVSQVDLTTMVTGLLPIANLAPFSYIKFSNTQASGTNGGTGTTGAWRTVPLNTEDFDTASIASITSNQMTLPAGTYKVSCSCPFSRTDKSQSRLRDITNSATLLTGQALIAQTGISQDFNSIIMGQFTIAGSTVIELQYQVQTTISTSGLGNACSFGSEVYAQIEFLKVA